LKSHIQNFTLHVRCSDDLVEGGHVAAVAGIKGAIMLKAFAEAVVEGRRPLNWQQRSRTSYQECRRTSAPPRPPAPPIGTFRGGRKAG
jgi:hypothetical protein